MPSSYQIVLSGQEQAVLAARAWSVRGSYRDRLRAAIVLAAAAGQASAAIARQLGVCTGTVRKWRRRLAEGRLAGLKDAPRSGRPPSFTAADRAEVIALACALPAESGVPLARWSGPDLARELAARCELTVSASRSAGGWPVTPSSPGSTGRGSLSVIPGSLPEPGGSPACTPGSGPAGRWAPMTM
jgi:transposase-like protein